MIKVRSLLAAIACENKEKNANIEQIINSTKIDRRIGTSRINEDDVKVTT